MHILHGNHTIITIFCMHSLCLAVYLQTSPSYYVVLYLKSVFNFLALYMQVSLLCSALYVSSIYVIPLWLEQWPGAMGTS